MKKIMFAMSCLVICLLITVAVSPGYAGPNASAVCGLDTDITTEAVEPALDAETGEVISVGLVARNVRNLDTYQVEVDYDPDALEFMAGYEDAPSMGIRNLLKANGGTAIGFQAVEKRPGLLNIANSLAGKDTAQAPEGSGIIAVLRFRVIGERPAELGLVNVRFADSFRNEDVVVKTEGGRIN